MAKILLKDLKAAEKLYAMAMDNWGEKNQITVRAMIKYYDLKKQYENQQTFKSRKRG